MSFQKPSIQAWVSFLIVVFNWKIHDKRTINLTKKGACTDSSKAMDQIRVTIKHNQVLCPTMEEEKYTHCLTIAGISVD